LNETPLSVNTGIEILPVGESAIVIEFGKTISPAIHRKVRALARYLDSYPFPGMVEYVAAYTSITVFYDPVIIKNRNDNQEKADNQLSYTIVSGLIEECMSKLDDSFGGQARIVEIPVCYGGDFGPDIEYVAEYNKLTVNEVIDIHSSGQYLVYMIGFAPGFPYVGGMSERISTPRRQSPRMSIPAGTVGIAGMQTGVYPIVTPGGWQLIGRTPLALFRPNEQPPSLLQSGDIVRFCPISYKEFMEYKGEGQ